MRCTHVLPLLRITIKLSRWALIALGIVKCAVAVVIIEPFLTFSSLIVHVRSVHVRRVVGTIIDPAITRAVTIVVTLHFLQRL